jgi:peptide/nickel transport system substrate-binding protein
MANSPVRAWALHDQRKKRLTCRVLMAVALLLLLAGCRTPGERPVPAPTPSSTPRPFTVMSTDQIRVTDPAAITDAASTVLALNVFQG